MTMQRTLEPEAADPREGCDCGCGDAVGELARPVSEAEEDVTDACGCGCS